MSGFSKLGSEGGKLDITSFKPLAEGAREISVEEERVADRVAERRGLPAEPEGRIQLDRGKTVQDRMFVQGPLVTLNRFRKYCNENRVSLHKGLELLLDRADR